MAAYPLLPTVNLMAWFPAAWAGNVASTLVSVYRVMVAGSPPITRVVPAGWLAPNPVPSNTKVLPPTKTPQKKDGFIKMQNHRIEGTFQYFYNIILTFSLISTRNLL